MAMWRAARPEDDEAIVEMSQWLYERLPPPDGVTAEQVRITLGVFRDAPVRGRALVLEDEGASRGFAFLVSFWSNELGGEICTIDELYVEPALRGRGSATALVNALREGSSLWPRDAVALELEVSPANPRARALYERVGFREKRNTTLRMLLTPSA